MTDPDDKFPTLSRSDDNPGLVSFEHLVLRLYVEPRGRTDCLSLAVCKFRRSGSSQRPYAEP